MIFSTFFQIVKQIRKINNKEILFFMVLAGTGLKNPKKAKPWPGPVPDDNHSLVWYPAFWGFALLKDPGVFEIYGWKF